jgi:acyl-coenzyme A thioesterase PaaI-like protein
MASSSEQIPAGYSRHFRSSPLTDAWEPLYSKAENGSIILALRIRHAHCNSRGFAHGGLISALADNAMGLSLSETVRSTQQKEPGGLVTISLVTISLALDFLGAGKVDQWLEVVPRVLRAGGSLGFADCLVRADNQTIARGNATFRIFRGGED